MRTDLPTELLATDQGQRANDILRACVHCGFCNATCPTYQLTGDELDGPRGRIYLMRDFLQTGENATRTEFHLDRCLTCRACETTCPSGVSYAELADISRAKIGPKRGGWNGVIRAGLRWAVPNAARLRRLSRLGNLFRWFVPAALQGHLPDVVGKSFITKSAYQRKILLFNGCAQQVATPQTNMHLRTLLERYNIGVDTHQQESCCGALDIHLGAEATGLELVRRNVDLLYAQLDEVEAFVSTASGCGVTLKDYGRLLAGDAEYAERAAAVASRVVDVSEYLCSLGLSLKPTRTARKVAWHAPCTLQHGQGLGRDVETLLTKAGYELTPVADAHLCCGSAGSYAILQEKMATQLKRNKLAALRLGGPEIIATANVGCQTHLAHGTDDVEVVHWIELLM